MASGETVVLSLDTANGTAINPADFGDLQNASYNAATNELTLTGPFTNGATVASLTVDACSKATRLQREPDGGDRWHDGSRRTEHDDYRQRRPDVHPERTTVAEGASRCAERR